MNDIQNLETRLLNKLKKYKESQATLIKEITDLKGTLDVEKKDHDMDGVKAISSFFGMMLSTVFTIICIIIAISTQKQALFISLLFVMVGFSTAVWTVFNGKNWLLKFQSMRKYTAFCEENHPVYENKLKELEKIEEEIIQIKKTLCIDEA